MTVIKGKLRPRKGQNRRPGGHKPKGTLGMPGGPQAPGKMGNLPIKGIAGHRAGPYAPSTGFGPGLHKQPPFAGAGPSMADAGAPPGPASVLPPGGGVPGGPMKGQLRRKGVSPQWIKRQLKGQDWTWGGLYQDRGGASDNQGLERRQLGQLMNSLADQGMGRKGLSFLLNNQRAQSQLTDGRSGRLLQGINPGDVRWMMRNGYSGDVDINNGQQYVGDQGDLFAARPDLLRQYVMQTGARRNGGFRFGAYNSFDDWQNAYNHAQGLPGY